MREGTLLMASPLSTRAIRLRRARRLRLLKSSGARQTVICPSYNKFTNNLPQAAELTCPSHREIGSKVCGCKLLGRVDGAAADDGAEDARLGELGRGDFGEVVRKNNVIGVLARFQLTLLTFFELSVRGT